MDTKNEIVLYEDSNGDIELRADVEKDTLWATQDQIASLFQTQRPAVTKHIHNIFRTKELVRDSVRSILERTGPDGKRYKVQHFNLDMIIAVGYRVNSKKATKFRIWATKTLKSHILNGFTLHNHKLQNSPESLENLHKTLALIGSPDVAGKLKGSVTLRVTKKIV